MHAEFPIVVQMPQSTLSLPTKQIELFTDSFHTSY